MRRVNRAADKMVKKVVAHNKTQKKGIQESISDLYRVTENYAELCSDLDRLESKGSNSDFLRSGSTERIESFTKDANIEREIPESWEKMVLQLSKVHSDDDVFARLMIGDFAYETIGVDFEYMSHGILDAHRGPLQFEMDGDTSRSSSFYDIAILEDVDSGLSLRVAKGLNMKSVARMSELDRNHNPTTAHSPDLGQSPFRSFTSKNELHSMVAHSPDYGSSPSKLYTTRNEVHPMVAHNHDFAHNPSKPFGTRKEVHPLTSQSSEFGASSPTPVTTRTDVQQDVPVVYPAASPWNVGFEELKGSPSVSSKGQPIVQAPISITEPKEIVSREPESRNMCFYLGASPPAESVETLTTITSPSRGESLLKKSSSQVKITHERTLRTDFHGHGLAMGVNKKGHMVWSGCAGNGWTLQERDQSGSTIWEKKPKDWTKTLPDSLAMVTQGDTEFIAVAFAHMHQIKLIKPETDQEILAYEHLNQEPHKIQWLPPNKMLVLDRSKFPVMIHVQDCSVLPWKHIQTMDTGLNFAHEFTYVETPEGVYVVATSLDDFSIRAFHLESSTMVWELLGQVDGHLLLPGGLAADSQGHIYITDTNNRRLLVVNIAGHVIQTHSTAARPTSVYTIPSDNKILVKYVADGTWVVSVWNVEPE